MGDEALDFALQIGKYETAFDIAEQLVAERIPQVHLSRAMRLEDEGSFRDAEVHFIKAGIAISTP